MSHSRHPVRLLVILLMLCTGIMSGQAQETTEVPAPSPTVALPTPSEEASPEQTAEPTLQSTPSPETTVEAPTATPGTAPTDTPAPAPADEPAPAESALEVVAICLVNGPAFVITNHGADMPEPSYYELTGGKPAVDEIAPDLPVDEPAETPAVLPDDAPTPEAPVDEAAPALAEVPTPEPEPEAEDPALTGTPFMLAAGESLTVSGGTSLRIGDEVFAADASCAAAPVLSVSAVCVFETGAAFTVENSGGPMSAELPYTLTSADGETVSGELLLAAAESVTIEAGFGEPAFTSGDLTSALEAPCYAPAQVSGIVWEDANLDGVRDETEPGINNVTVHLVDPAGFALTVVTAEDGSYSFEMLPGASFTVQVDTTTLPAGYELTTPVGGEASAALDVLMGLTYTADFGFSPLPTASISGALWLETGNFGVRDGSEMGVAGAMVELLDETGALIATVPMDAVTGAYSFTELFSGVYTVRLAQATLFTPIGVTWDLDGDLNFETVITLEAGQTLTGADFGVVGTF